MCLRLVVEKSCGRLEKHLPSRWVCRMSARKYSAFDQFFCSGMNLVLLCPWKWGKLGQRESGKSKSSLTL